MVSSVAPRPTAMAPYGFTASCMRMLWNSASASSPARRRSSGAAGSRSTRSSAACAASTAASAPIEPARPRAAHRLGLERLLVDQALPHVGVVVGAIERLLKAPVEQIERRRLALHRLELLQRRVDAGVRGERTAPVALEREQPLRERVGVAIADEEAAVLAQRLQRIRVTVPAEHAPDRSC